MKTKQFQKVHAKWFAAKLALDAARAAEMSLRSELENLMAQDKLDEFKFEDDLNTYSFKRQENYSVPAAAIPDIKAHLDEKVFESAFSVSYKLKPAIFENLTGKPRQVIQQHLTIKPAPMSVTVKQK